MKYILIPLSLLCLAFTFRDDFYGGFNNTTSANAAVEAAAAIGNTAPETGGKATSASNVVTKALALEAMLSGTNLSSLQQTYSTSLARKWSNLPCGSGCRNGVQFSSLTATQLDAAKAVIQAAAGTVANEGYDEFIQIITADSLLGTISGGGGPGGGAYSKGNYFICFLNTPSTTGSWMLQFGGHHYAANIAFSGGRVIGATPRFEGVEPTSFTAANGQTYAPITGEHDAMAAMLASLTTAQLTTAKITGQTFSDVTLAPGETNGGSGTFPTTKAGVPCSSLSTASQALVIAAMQHWVQDMDDSTAMAIMATYTAELANTYISYAGNGTSGTASSFLTTNTNYARIDGPTVWIEFVCQTGVVFPSQIHYHTVWRDHSHDYGVDLSGTAIDNATSSGGVGVSSISNTISVAAYPNPAGDYINIALPARLTAATVRVISMSTGQTLITRTDYSGPGVGLNVAGLPAGFYAVRIYDGTTMYSAKFTKL